MNDSGTHMGEVPIQSEIDIVTVRKTVRSVAGAIGFSITGITRIVTASSELARNVHVHGGGTGVMRWRKLNSGSPGIELVFEDWGPGIEDVTKALEPGYTTGKGLGMGVPGAKRLMGELEIQSEPGQGTVVTARSWLKGR